MGMNKIKGGSIASDKVNSLSPKICNVSKNPTIPSNKMDRCFTINNYSSVYKTTGGNKKSKKKGGSIASDRVNALSPKLYNNNNYSTINDTNIDRCFAINNYSTTYKTTGGKKKKTKKGGRVLM